MSRVVRERHKTTAAQNSTVLVQSGHRTWDTLMDVTLVFDPIAGVGESLAAVPTQVGLVLRVAANMFPHIFQ